MLPAADGSQPTISNTSDGAPFIGLPAPRPVAAFSFTDRDDAQVTLADFDGRMMLLNLWATWCMLCRKEMSALDRPQAKLGGASIIAIPLSIDHPGRDAVARFYREPGLKSLSIYRDKTANVTCAVNARELPAANASEASPQTDETCDGGGSGRRYMTRIW